MNSVDKALKELEEQLALMDETERLEYLQSLGFDVELSSEAQDFMEPKNEEAATSDFKYIDYDDFKLSLLEIQRMSKRLNSISKHYSIISKVGLVNYDDTNSDEFNKNNKVLVLKKEMS